MAAQEKSNSNPTPTVDNTSDLGIVAADYLVNVSTPGKDRMTAMASPARTDIAPLTTGAMDKPFSYGEEHVDTPSPPEDNLLSPPVPSFDSCRDETSPATLVSGDRSPHATAIVSGEENLVVPLAGSDKVDIQLLAEGNRLATLTLTEPAKPLYQVVVEERQELVEQVNNGFPDDLAAQAKVEDQPRQSRNLQTGAVLPGAVAEASLDVPPLSVLAVGEIQDVPAPTETSFKQSPVNTIPTELLLATASLPIPSYPIDEEVDLQSAQPDEDSRSVIMSDHLSDSGETTTSGLETAPSMYSYRSSRDGQFMRRDVHGRMVNGQTELYALPADDEEYARLDTQHVMLRASLDESLYPGKEQVQSALSPDAARSRSILDVGTGAGIWAIDMAHEFPHAEVVGVDLVLPTRTAPSNCRFEADDVSLGMSHYHGCFDVVHARAVSHGIPDFKHFIDDISDTVREGGILIMVDGTLQLFRADKSRMEASESPFQRVLFEAYNALKSRGSGVDTGLRLKGLMEDNPKLKNHGYHEAFIPIGPWYDGNGTLEDRRRWHFMGELLRHDCKGFAVSLRPVLLSEGFRPDCVDRMINDAHKELDENRLNGWAVWLYAWAERETYDKAPLNPKPVPPEDLPRAEMMATSEPEHEQERSAPVHRSNEIVKLWLEDNMSDAGQSAG